MNSTSIIWVKVPSQWIDVAYQCDNLYRENYMKDQFAVEKCCYRKIVHTPGMTNFIHGNNTAIL